MKTISLYVIAFFILSLKSYSQCSVSFGAPVALTPTSEQLYFTCCVTGTYYIEYGLPGFTPGTQASPGAGGTVVSLVNPSNGNYNLTGLTGGTLYDLYVRVNCSTGWSANSALKQFLTMPDCALATSLSCGTMTTTSLAALPNSLVYTLLSCSGSDGREAVYSFTPSISGTHSLFVGSLSINAYAYFSYKQASAGCTASGWTCIGSVHQFNAPQSLSFGPLTAGTTYYILVDKSITTTALTVTFRIECPYCAQPTGTSATNITPNSATINYPGYSSTLDIVEYGLAGFIPGTGLTAGGGTVVNFGAGGIANLTGLSGSTGYNYYVRRYCSAGIASPNSQKGSFATPNCPQTSTYPALGTTVSTYYQLWGRGVFDQYTTGTCSGTYYAKEAIFKFTPPSSGYFSTNVSFINSNYGNNIGFIFLTRQANGLCTTNSGATCQYSTTFYGPQTVTQTINLGPLTAGTTYDLMFDNTDTTIYNWPYIPAYVELTISCPQPSVAAASDIRPTSMNLAWTCNCATTFLEYGPTGFTPGTGATPGTNGTVIQNVTTPYTLSGLTANTEYDIYLRSECGGNFSNNTTYLRQRTAVDCSAAQAIGCGQPTTYQTNQFQTGAWSSYGCGASGNNAIEKIYSFTPSQTGTHSLMVYSAGTGNYGYSYTTRYYFKAAGPVCNEQGWTCLGEAIFYQTFTPVSFPLGTLTAGTAYHILVDGVNGTYNSHWNTFRVECPNTCYNPVLSSATQVSATSENINSCATCFGSGITLEYGPNGFTPGTGSAPGVNGTVINGISSFPVTINGLTSGNAYHVYARKDCGAGVYSTNSPALAFTLCSTAPNGSTASPNTTVCPGTQVTLTATGGIAATGGTYKWYSGSCGGTLAGTGISIIVTPSATTTYYARIESACGNTICTSRTVFVSGTAPTATITAAGAVTFCTGGSVTLNANTGSGLTYQWKLNGGNISGATTSSYLVTSSGSYTCSVSTSCGSATSNAITVTVVTTATASISAVGTTTICNGGSVTLNANTGNGLSWQWRLNAGNISGATASSYSATSTGSYSCITTNACGSATSNTIAITAGSSPGAPSIPAGAAIVCRNTTGNVYSVPQISGATSYTWTAPSGAIISSGQGTNTVGIDFGSSAISGNICVYASNGCGNSGTSCFALLVVTTNPTTPASITGTDLPCASSNGVPYSCPVVANASGYYWVVPATATIASGQGTNSITVDFSSGFSTGTVKVRSVNCFGNSSYRSLSVRGKPSTPGLISGPATGACAGTTQAYSIAAVTGATTYTWTAPNNATISTGQGTTSVTVAFSASFTSGTLKVTSGNSCGSSASRSLTLFSTPATPGLITGPVNGVCAGTNGVPYSIASVSGASSYLWTAPPNASIATGQGTTSVTVNFSGSFTYGTLSVRSVNTCGSSSLRTTTVRSVPVTPGTMTGAATVCANQAGVPYSIVAVTGATTYDWTVPTGAVVSMGQGTTSVTVNFGTSAGSVKVRSGNACGYSTYRTKSITINCREAGAYGINDNGLLIFPNPAQDHATLAISSTLSGKAYIRLTDISGRLVSELKVDVVEGNNYIDLDLAELSRGSYMVTVVTGENRWMEKVVIE